MTTNLEERLLPPETIYLLDMGDCWAWCDTPDPDHQDRTPLKYVRTQSSLLKQMAVSLKETNAAAAALMKVALQLGITTELMDAMEPHKPESFAGFGKRANDILATYHQAMGEE